METPLVVSPVPGVTETGKSGQIHLYLGWDGATRSAYLPINLYNKDKRFVALSSVKMPNVISCPEHFSAHRVIRHQEKCFALFATFSHFVSLHPCLHNSWKFFFPAQPLEAIHVS